MLLTLVMIIYRLYPEEYAVEGGGGILSISFTNRPTYFEFCSMFARHSNMFWLTITAIVDVIIVNTFFLCSLFFIFSHVWLVLLLSGATCLFHVQNSIVELGCTHYQHLNNMALRFAVIDYNIHFWEHDWVKVRLPEFI